MSTRSVTRHRKSTARALYAGFIREIKKYNDTFQDRALTKVAETHHQFEGPTTKGVFEGDTQLGVNEGLSRE